MRVGTLCCLATIALLACGGDDSGSGDDDGLVTSGNDSGTGPMGCIDEDDDGFGRRCTRGLDCDDADPTVTNECRRCIEPNKDCPCEPGTEMMHCKPEDIRTTMNGVTGVLACSEGVRYCRDGAWTDCEILWQYATFTPD